MHSGGNASAKRCFRTGQKGADAPKLAAFLPEPIGLTVPPRHRGHGVVGASQGGKCLPRQARRPSDQRRSRDGGSKRRKSIGRFGQSQNSEASDACCYEPGHETAPPGPDRNLVRRRAGAARDVAARVQRVGLIDRSKGRRTAVEVHRQGSERQVEQQVQPMVAGLARQGLQPGGCNITAQRWMQVVQARRSKTVTARPGAPRRRHQNSGKS